MSQITLDKLVPGESGRIKKVHGTGAIRRRLVDMGITSGAEIEMIKLSPLGDPVEYRLRGYHLSLRKSEARTIEVELVSNPLPPKPGRISGRSLLPLGRVGSGQRVVITTTRGGKKLNQRLKKLGLFPGLSVDVIRNEFAGPLVISVNGDRLEIGKGLSRHIMVETV